MPQTPAEVIRMYKDGFPGAPCDKAYEEWCFGEKIILTPEEVRLDSLYAGEGKRALLWRSREKFDPGAFGEEAQETGDCVSHGDRNCRDTTRCVEIDIKNEPEEYKCRGATEPTYNYRGHRGAGMNPARAATFVHEVGWVGRQDYPGCVDLRKYDVSFARRYSSGPPDCLRKICLEHKVGSFVRPNSVSEALRLFQNGHACHSGQNIGFSSRPDARGIHPRRGSWNHDMATVGYDDTKEIWPSRVYFVVNSWGAHNYQWRAWNEDKALQAILGPPITGMIVCPADVWERYFLGGGSIFFYADIEGFRAKRLPDYGTSSFLGGS